MKSVHFPYRSPKKSPFFVTVSWEKGGGNYSGPAGAFQGGGIIRGGIIRGVGDYSRGVYDVAISLNCWGIDGKCPY